MYLVLYVSIQISQPKKGFYKFDNNRSWVCNVDIKTSLVVIFGLPCILQNKYIQKTYIDIFMIKLISLEILKLFSRIQTMDTPVVNDSH